MLQVSNSTMSRINTSDHSLPTGLRLLNPDLIGLDDAYLNLFLGHLYSRFAERSIYARNDTLAEYMGFSVNTVKRCFKKAAELGFITLCYQKLSPNKTQRLALLTPRYLNAISKHWHYLSAGLLLRVKHLAPQAQLAAAIISGYQIVTISNQRLADKIGTTAKNAGHLVTSLLNAGVIASRKVISFVGRLLTLKPDYQQATATAAVSVAATERQKAILAAIDGQLSTYKNKKILDKRAAQGKQQQVVTQTCHDKVDPKQQAERNLLRMATQLGITPDELKQLSKT